MSKKVSQDQWADLQGVLVVEQRPSGSRPDSRPSSVSVVDLSDPVVRDCVLKCLSR